MVATHEILVTIPKSRALGFDLFDLDLDLGLSKVLIWQKYNPQTSLAVEGKK